MRTSFLAILLLCCLMVVAGCGSARAVPGLVSGVTPTSTAAPTSAPRLTPTPSPTAVTALAGCPKLAAAQPGAAPAAPLSLYLSRFSAADNSVSLAALNASDGSTRWQATIDRDGHAMTSVVVGQNVVYEVTAAGMIAALNASDGRLRWCVSEASKVLSAPNTDTGATPQLAFDQGVVYAAGGCRGVLLALNAGDGSPRWQAQPGGCVSVEGAVDGQVYGSYSETANACGLFAFRERDGQEAWCFRPEYQFASGPVAVGGVVYVSEAQSESGPGFLDALNASDGTMRYQGPTSPGTSLRLVTVAGGAAYGVVTQPAADASGIAAFAASSGTPLWQVSASPEMGPAVGTGALYVCSVGGTPTAVQPTVSALSTSAGQPLWQATLPDTLPAGQVSGQVRPAANATFGQTFNALSAVNGVVYVGYLANSSTGPTSVVVALDGGTGAQDWRAGGVLLAVG
jgi:outer membrane protein assembly factor BamB